MVPDGTKIAFTSERDGNFEIYIMNADGSAQTRLTADPATDWAPTWQPSDRISFASDRMGTDDVWSMRPDGSGLAPGWDP